jgi:hypothetical protein
MNEQLMAILEKAYDAALKTGEFIIDEGTILIQQFLLWKTFEHGFYVLLGLFFIIAPPLFFRWIAPYDEDGYYKFLGKRTSWEPDEPPFIFSAFGVGIGALIGLIIFFTNVLLFTKVLIAPNVYLLEFILNKV